MARLALKLVFVGLFFVSGFVTSDYMQKNVELPEETPVLIDIIAHETDGGNMEMTRLEFLDWWTNYNRMWAERDRLRAIIKGTK